MEGMGRYLSSGSRQGEPGSRVSRWGRARVASSVPAARCGMKQCSGLCEADGGGGGCGAVAAEAVQRRPRVASRVQSSRPAIGRGRERG